MTFLKREMEDYRLLLRNVPSLVVALFILSVVLMNFLANKEFISMKYLALDCGFVLSWVSFLCMDMICKHFGPRSAVKISILAMSINVMVCLVFALLATSPGMWGQYYETGSLEVNKALNDTVSGLWYVVLGSSVAMVCAAITNSTINHAIAKSLDYGGFRAFATRSYISTFAGQFIDNLVFSVIVSVHFFGWTWTQVLFCSLTGACMEIICEIVFSPLGYKICVNWENHRVGEQYLKYRANGRIIPQKD